MQTGYVDSAIFEDFEGGYIDASDVVVLEDYEVDDAYEEFLTEIYGEISVGHSTFDAGAILREMDPTAFRVGASDNYIEVNSNDYPELFED